MQKFETYCYNFKTRKDKEKTNKFYRLAKPTLLSDSNQIQKKSILSQKNMTEKLFQITRQINLILDEYDGEILANDEVNIEILY